MSSAGKRPTILIVDDDPAIRALLTEMLSMEGYAMETAKDGVEAIAFLRDLPPTFRIILLDLLMPNIDGWGVVRWITEHPEIRANTKIVLMSANDRLKQAYDLEQDGRLVKPFDLGTLLETITKLSM